MTSTRSHPRVILHIDMDAFYAAVEVREDPSLAGLPLIIGHRGRRGVVSTCSYEAREFGVRSAMPSVTAARLCPDATWLSGNMGLYVEISREIRQIFNDFSPLVEPLSIDEAFLDLTSIATDLDDGCRIARDIKNRIRGEQSLTASVGIAPNKFLAKVASDMDKPDGLVRLSRDDIPARLWPLPVRRLWGVGEKTGKRLVDHGIHTVRDVLEVPQSELAKVVGLTMCQHLRALAGGHDERAVVSGHRRKSISEERTYSEDLTDPEAIDRALLERAEGVARVLRSKHLLARTVHIKVRTGDFTTWTRAHTLPAPADATGPIVQAARFLFNQRIDLGGRGVRLLGVGVSNLLRCEARQTSLFPDAEGDRERRLTEAADLIRDRLGDQALVRAKLLRRPGPDDDEPEEASSLPAVD